MADNVLIPGLSATVATDDDGTAQHQSIKIMAGANGTFRRWLGYETTAGGFVSAATNNATVVKASAGWLHWLSVSNKNAAVRYLKVYNKATTPAPASDNALLVFRLEIPVSSLTPLFIAFPQPIYCSSGIGIALVTGISDTDNTSVAASEHVVGFGYE